MNQTPPPMPPPQWTPPPQQPVGWGGPVYTAPPSRPIGLTLAAAYLLVMGLFVAGILGGCGLIIGTAILAGAASENQGGFGAVAFGVGVFPLIVGILSIAAGIGTFVRAGFARWLGIISGALAALYFGVLALLFITLKEIATDQNPLSGAGIVLAAIAVLYVLVVVAYLFAGSYFSNRPRGV
jgi:hypothetical protein